MRTMKHNWPKTSQRMTHSSSPTPSQRHRLNMPHIMLTSHTTVTNNITVKDSRNLAMEASNNKKAVVVIVVDKGSRMDSKRRLQHRTHSNLEEVTNTSSSNNTETEAEMRNTLAQLPPQVPLSLPRLRRLRILHRRQQLLPNNHKLRPPLEVAEARRKLPIRAPPSRLLLVEEKLNSRNPTETKVEVASGEIRNWFLAQNLSLRKTVGIFPSFDCMMMYHVLTC